MKTWIALCFALIVWQSQAQSIVGSWQLTDEKTCFESEMENMKKSDTEKELEKSMGGSGQHSVARVIKFDKKGGGEDGIFSTGKKKAADMSAFKYKINGNELDLLDVKSGIITQRLIIDELTESNLKVHNAVKDCEMKVFTRIK
ncbi:MAG TPA: hypothetical protein VG737_04220 [Cyclobacteriaceae bacterium]|nr:hypothetical protein [Cyclobacteriaceae bacterium]